MHLLLESFNDQWQVFLDEMQFLSFWRIEKRSIRAISPYVINMVRFVNNSPPKRVILKKSPTHSLLLSTRKTLPLEMETLFSNKSWFLKYKLHHLAFWASYHFIFWTAYEGSALRILEALTHPYLLLKYLSYVVFQALGVYFCLYFLIPRFLIKGKYLAFLSLLTFTIVAIAAFIYSGYHMAGWVAGKDVRLLFNLGDKPVSSLFYLNSLPSSLASMTLPR